MFYSHQLLARKAPLGQIWMAATMHAKMNKRKLDKLNIIKICEEILNPSVPMALRLSGILMGGVVIVYERKVKLLYDDVTRLLVEINEAWKVKAVPDPTVLPKGKSQAKREAVTLPDHVETDLGEIERPLHFSNTTATVGFQQTAYFAMRLDSVDESFVNNDPREDLSHHFHQVDVDNITLCERFDSYQADGNLHNRFERFDIEGDEETQMNFMSAEHTEIPTTFIPSPPPRDEPQQGLPVADEIHDHNPEFQVNQISNEFKEANQDQRGQGPVKRKTRRPATIIMDYDQTIISGHMYQSWLQGGSDLISNRGRKRKHADVMSTMKIADLMELPPVVLSCRLIANGNREIQYPAPLLELWRRSTQTPQDSPSRRTSPPLPPEPSSASPPNRVHYQEPAGLPFEDLYSGVGSQSVGTSIEKQRQNLVNNDMATENFMEELRANLAKNEKATENIIEELRVNLMNNGVGVTESNLMATPGNSGGEVRSIPSSGSGPGVLHNWEVISGRLNKKRTGSSSRHGGSGLEPVAEENLWQHPDPNFKLRSQPEIGPTLEQELLVETGPTQTQRPHISQPIDKITDSIKMQMKTHFDTPGAPKIESLDSLAFGMNKTAAARLFYQTCVLATHDFLRVEQKMPYGDILISKGAKM